MVSDGPCPFILPGGARYAEQGKARDYAGRGTWVERVIGLKKVASILLAVAAIFSIFIGVFIFMTGDKKCEEQDRVPDAISPKPVCVANVWEASDRRCGVTTHI